jgi:N-methylhydantoinase A
MNEPEQSKRVAVDIGGTFTDLAWHDPATNTVAFEKVLSTPPRFAEGVHQILAKGGVDMSEVLHFVHGSTVAVNAVIQKRGAKTGLIATEGFSDIYEIGRANRPDTYNLFFEKAPLLVPATLRFGVRERMDAAGNVVTPISAASVKAAIRKLRAAKVEAVAVCLLHSYANPAHEIAVGELLRKLMPKAFVTLSHEILREYREYERTSTTVLNCYVGPEVSRYLTEIDTPLREQNFRGTFYVMQSNGGAMTAARAVQAPVATMESGPAGGIIGAASVGKTLGFENVIGFDMGGTTAKACLIERGLPRMTDQYYVGGYRDGYPMRLPVVDIIEVGAGGGSIAWVDPAGGLKVGPQSAGASPGPACYGLGGTAPTVTDGNLMIGRLNAERFLGGDLHLDRAAAKDAIERVVAKQFGMSLIEAAHGIIKIADARMSAVVRAITLQRGYDPRDFTLIAFGGGGPLHAGAIARELRIPRVVIPPQPGHFSALGMLWTDLRHDFVQTRVMSLEDVSPAALDAWFEPMEKSGLDVLRSEGSAASDTLLLRSVDIRYMGQEYTVTVPLLADARRESRTELRERFDAAYEQRYGHADPAVPAQIVTLRLAAVGLVVKPETTAFHAKANADATPPGVRPVYFDDDKQMRETPVWQRGALPADREIEGPVIIEEHASTTVVHPGDRIRADASGSLVMTIGQG